VHRERERERERERDFSGVREGAADVAFFLCQSLNSQTRESQWFFLLIGEFLPKFGPER